MNLEYQVSLTKGDRMRIVVALGGNALARRGEPMTAEYLRANVRSTCEALAALASENEMVITHGNGPQVGLLALQNLAYQDVAAYPLDILGAETQGMIGYVVQQELSNALNGSREVAGIITTTVVDESDPAFERPTKLIGPQYSAHDAAEAAAEYRWTIAKDGKAFRRVVPWQQDPATRPEVPPGTLAYTFMQTNPAGGSGLETRMPCAPCV